MNRVDNEYFDCDGDYFPVFKTYDERQNLIVMYANAQSCANMRTFHEIKYFIMETQCKIDIIVLSETWFKESETFLYDIDGYTAVHSCRGGRRGGGVSIYVKLPCQITMSNVIATEINLISLDIVNYKNFDNLRVIGA